MKTSIVQEKIIAKNRQHMSKCPKYPWKNKKQ